MSSSWKVGVAAVLAAGLWTAPVLAQEGEKALPTLLIKGDVVSVETGDPAATVLKVKDRYGFETEIILTQDTKITQGQTPLAVSSLTAGSKVEVEYNFDVNTAKRYAVAVVIPAPEGTAEAAPVAEPVVAAPEATPEAPPAE